MQPDATYSIVRHLERAGQWDLAHFLGDDHPESKELREIGLATAAELGLKWLLRNE